MPASITSGIRLGTNSLAIRGMGENEIVLCASLIHRVLTTLTVRSDTTYLLDTSARKVVLEEVQDLCRRFPIPHYSVAR